MEIDDKLITYLEDLSYLTLADDEKERLKGDLREILGRMAEIGNFDTQNVHERSHPFDDINVFREDKVRPSLDRELVLANAPQRNDEAIIAPRTVE